MLFFLIRHGEPIYDPDSLTPMGHQQAEAVAKRFACHGLDRIFTSTSNRAIQTALPTCRLLHKEYEALDWCNETHAYRNFSIVTPDGRREWMFEDPETLELLVSPEIRALGDAWYEHPHFAGTTSREGTAFIQRESDAFFRRLGYMHDRERHVFHCTRENDERVALFAHSGFTLNFLSAVLDIPYPMVSTRFSAHHSCVTVIEFQNQPTLVPRVFTFSNDAHLYSEGLPIDVRGHTF